MNSEFDKSLSPTDSALIGPGHFQWNLGGWFGAAFGSTAWMLVLATFLCFHQPQELAFLPVASFVAVIALAILLWISRDLVYPFDALLYLLGMLAVVLPVVWTIVSTSASNEALKSMNWPPSPVASVAVCLATPIVMGCCYFLENSTIRKRSRASADH